MPLYKEVAISRIALALLTVVTLVVIGVVMYYSSWLPALIAGWLPFLLLLSFFSLTVVVDRESVLIRYGIGLVTHHFPLVAILKCEIVPNNSWTWIYHPTASHILLLHLRENHRRIGVSVSEPKKVMNLIQSIIRDA